MLLLLHVNIILLVCVTQVTATWLVKSAASCQRNVRQFHSAGEWSPCVMCETQLALWWVMGDRANMIILAIPMAHPKIVKTSELSSLFCCSCHCNNCLGADCINVILRKQTSISYQSVFIAQFNTPASEYYRVCTEPFLGISAQTFNAFHSFSVKLH